MRNLSSIRTYWTTLDKSLRQYIIVKDLGCLPIQINKERYNRRVHAMDAGVFALSKYSGHLIPLTREQAIALVGHRITFVI